LRTLRLRHAHKVALLLRPPTSLFASSLISPLPGFMLGRDVARGFTAQ
jgi:hypothetical protein